MSLLTDFRFAFRSLMRVKGLAATVVVTLALGIGANAAIFSVVRGVLLKPLVNRDEDCLIYIRQSAQGLGQDSVVFSVPEIQDLRARVTTLTAFGEFSQIGFTIWSNSLGLAVLGGISAYGISSRKARSLILLFGFRNAGPYATDFRAVSPAQARCSAPVPAGR